MAEGKILVTGGRDFKDRTLIYRVLDLLQSEFGAVRELVQSGASGAEAIARSWARYNFHEGTEAGLQVGTLVTTFKPKWRILGRYAAAIRCAAMILGNSDASALVAFPGSNPEIIESAKKAGMPVILVAETGDYHIEAGE